MAIKPFHVMKLLARARGLEAQGRTIIHMEVGEPDFLTPQAVIDAGIQSIKSGDVHYTPATGLPALREAIADFYAQTFNVEIPSQRIIITPGASGALMLALSVLLDRDDRVIMADPGYPCNRHFVRLLEGQTISVPVNSDSKFQLTAELLEQHWQEKVKVILLASPSNPTGTLVAEDQLKAIIDFVQQKQVMLIVDEIYQSLVYNRQAVTVLSKTDNVFVINSFSKYFSMTGWRVGWLVVPEGYTTAIDNIAQNIYLAAPTPGQYAALAAFKSETINILEQRRLEFKRRRDYLLEALIQLGFDVPVTPQGAFYIYANCEKFTHDSFEFCHRCLEQAGVAVTPGIDFGEHNASKYIRFAYTTSLENLQQGIQRLQAFLQAR